MPKKKKELVIFGSAEIAKLCRYYFDHDSNYNVVAFTVDDPYADVETIDGLPLVPFSEIIDRFPPDRYSMHVGLSYQRMNQLREEKYLQAKDPLEKKTHWANYEKALKIQINSIKDKYIKPEKGTSEFALLFIPSEAIYYETIAEKNHLGDPCQIYEYATAKKVIPVSPNTFYAFLNVIILGIRNIEIATEAKKLQELLSRLEKDYGFFFKNFEDIGKAIEKAGKAYDTGKGQVQRFKKNLDSAIAFEIAEPEDAKDELSAENK